MSPKQTTLQADTETADFTVHLPSRKDLALDQDEEWCAVQMDGKMHRYRFHDYDELYKVPGLYEHLFYETLECQSPEVICELLGDQLAETSSSPQSLRVLDIGAGNGVVGETLAEMGADEIVGVDIIPEAAEAAMRDRPEVYDDYHVLDLTKIPEPIAKSLRAQGLNCLVTVAALGFGDMPAFAFANAFNLLCSPAWVAFNIRDRFLDEDSKESSGFSRLIKRMVKEGALAIRAKKRYRHRFNVVGEPLYYDAIIGVKTGQVDVEGIQG